jgi:hypothetical protein
MNRLLPGLEQLITAVPGHAIDTGVIHENIDLTKFKVDLTHHLPNRIPTRDINGAREMAIPREHSERLFRRLGPEINRGDPRAFPSETTRNFTAQA